MLLPYTFSIIYAINVTHLLHVPYLESLFFIPLLLFYDQRVHQAKQVQDCTG